MSLLIDQMMRRRKDAGNALDGAINALANKIAVWNLNETSGSAAVNANNPGYLDGTYSGTYTLAQTALCTLGGYAVNFDGSSAFVSFANGAFGTAVNGASAITACALVNCEGDTGTSQRVFNMIINSVTTGFSIVILPTRYVQITARSQGADSAQTLDSSNQINYGSASLIIAMADIANDTMTVWVDGTKTGPTGKTFGAGTYTQGAATTGDSIARYQSGVPAYYFDGKIDFAFLTNGTITDAEAAAILAAVRL